VDTSTPGQARVVFRADPGAFVEIGRVVIAGLDRTRESVVAKTIRRAGVSTGEPFARDRILLAQRRLYELGLFRRVELLPMPGQERSTQRGLVVNLEEGRQRSYLLGVGWNETDRFRVTLGWSHLNLFGGAHAFSAETRLSGREQRFQIGIREPRIPRLHVPGYLAIYRTFEDFATYSQRRSGLWFEIGDRRRVPFRPWFRYEYQIVRPNAPPDVLSELERENQEALISSITPTLEIDFRNDPLVPTGGTFSSVSLEYAFPAFSASSEFLKLQGRFTAYGKFLGGVGAAGFRIGAIEPLGPDTGEPENLQVPLNTRFFSGGASSHRGFETDFLGIGGQTIDDAGRPIGGNALVLINFEYQRKIQSIFWAVVFLDVGNVWTEPSLVRYEDFRYAAGIGLRLDTPAGPLRAEYGYKLDREPGESAGEFFLSFGIPF
jgi:outer membrane protein assembly factor BamA